MTVRRWSVSSALCGALTLSLAACSPSLPADAAWLGHGCFGTGTDMIIHGSPSDPRVTWVTTPDGRERVEIVWPVGYSARFVPALEVLDPTGKLVAREGDRLIGWCRTADTPDGVPIWVQATDVEGNVKPVIPTQGPGDPY